jgi:O-acetylserine/cysteine efflux transporter
VAPLLRTRWASLGGLLLAAALWGTASTITKYALRGFAPVTLLAVELTAATAALWAVLLLRGHRPAGSWPRVLALGLFEPALAYVSDTIGLSRTSATNGAVLSGLESVFVVILAAVFLRERIARVVAGSVVLAAVGVVVIEGSGTVSRADTGDLLITIGALSAAVYSILARGLDDDIDALSVTAHQFAVATVVTIPLAFMLWHSGSEPVPAEVPSRFWLAAVLVGVAGFALPFLLYNSAIVRIEAGVAGAVITPVPAFGVLSAVLLLHESLTPGRIAGCVLVGLSVAAVTARELSHGPAADA